MARIPRDVSLRGWARQDSDPVKQEIYRALAYHESTPPGSLIEMKCQRCPEAYYSTSPRQLASLIYEHMRSNHPEAWREPIPR